MVPTMSVCLSVCRVFHHIIGAHCCNNEHTVATITLDIIVAFDTTVAFIIALIV
jgi:hypothetical protein